MFKTVVLSESMMDTTALWEDLLVSLDIPKDNWPDVKDVTLTVCQIYIKPS